MVNFSGFGLPSNVNSTKKAVQPFFGAATLKPVSVDQVYVTPGKSTTLRFRVESDSPEEVIKYTIRDYRGQPVAAGGASVLSGGIIDVGPPLPRGFYEIEFPATKQRFGIVSLPAFRGPADTFFCIDSATIRVVLADKTAGRIAPLRIEIVLDAK